MDPAKMALYKRLTDLFGTYDATPEERLKILTATADADSWAKVPLGVQHLIGEIEKRPPQSWDDPADLPDQKGI